MSTRIACHKPVGTTTYESTCKTEAAAEAVVVGEAVVAEEEAFVRTAGGKTPMVVTVHPEKTAMPRVGVMRALGAGVTLWAEGAKMVVQAFEWAWALALLWLLAWVPGSDLA